MHPKNLPSRKEVELISKNPSVIDFERVPGAGEVYRCLSHELRQQILRVVKVLQPITVKDLYMALVKDQSVVSQNLDILREHNFVKREKEGKYSYYSLNEEALEKALENLGNVSATICSNPGEVFNQERR